MAIKPLILAIEPDSRQASHLAAAARRISVELLVVDSVAQALIALEGRLPDLILTPTLLPCRDDTMLTDRLREAGEAATHIQRLTTPLFEAEAPPSGRVRSALRKRKPGKGPMSCTAETFADQLAVYLECAADTHRKRRSARSRAPVSVASVPEPDAAPPPGDPPLIPDPPADDAAPALPPLSSALAALSTGSLNMESAASVSEGLPPPPEAASSVGAAMQFLSGVSIGEALVPTPPPALPEAASSIDSAMPLFGGASIGEAFVSMPPPALPEAASSIDTQMPVLAANSVGEMLVPMAPVALPSLPDVPPIRAVIQTGGGSLAGTAEPLVSCEPQAPELPRLVGPPAADNAGGRSSATRRPAPVAPNGRKQRKILRRMHANDWTA